MGKYSIIKTCQINTESKQEDSLHDLNVYGHSNGREAKLEGQIHLYIYFYSKCNGYLYQKNPPFGGKVILLEAKLRCFCKYS